MTVASGALLVVKVTVFGAGTPTSVKFGLSSFLVEQASATLSGAVGQASIWFGSPTGTGPIGVTLTGGTGFVTIQAVQIAGLASNLVDEYADANGTIGTPGVGVGTTTHSAECVEVLFLLVAPVGTWTYSSGFTNGGQDLSQTDSGTLIVATEGYEILSTFASPSASLSGITQTGYGAVMVTFY